MGQRRSDTGLETQHTEDAQANPLLLPRGPCLVDSLVELLVAIADVRDGFLPPLVDLLDRGFLFHDGGFHILEQLCQLDHLSLNLLDGLMSTLDGAQC